MQIIWYGANCFKLISSELTILTDPFSPEKSGFKNPRITSEIVIFSSLEEKKKVSAESFILSGPGEIEIKGIFISGLPHFEGKTFKTIYKLTIEDLKICFLDGISSTLTDEELDKLGEVDVLILPISKKSLSSERAIKVINEIEPTLIIPSNWQDKNEITEFIKEIGIKNAEETEKLKIKKKDLVKEKVKIAILKPNL